MKIVQSTWGTFHQFELAKQLHKREMLAIGILTLLFFAVGAAVFDGKTVVKFPLLRFGWS